ncbi:Beta-galactosidase [Sphingobium indicum BiD32]|uniref:Beta-galactosidase n=2 Tax=Sphingobium indicum TaxID=332055 RepID=N1MFH7_9SPHN|nr:Beta-galactosidase [Sphingobium indicum BiD32]
MDIRMNRLSLLAPLLLIATPVQALATDAPPSRTGVAEAASPRMVRSLDDGWRFRFGGDDSGVTAPGYDDGSWEAISIPHSWNHFGEYGLKRSAGANSAQGVGWYRRTVDAPVATGEQRHYLDFAAVGTIADLWVNGQHVGQHKGAFSRFRFDVTRFWRAGAPNLIVVKADNSKPAKGSSTEYVIPLAGDFFVHGGIYRGVSLITAPDAGIDLLDHAGPGIYARASSITAETAHVTVLARLRNQGKARVAMASAIIRDAAGVEVARRTMPVKLPAGSMTTTLDLDVARPHLWNGTADPYLYTVTVELRDKVGLFDRVDQPLGIRSFRFDANAGFFLNGRRIKLHGVSRHQDRAGKGWALSAQDHADDMALIREMGANTVRQAHYQHADEWTGEADRAGMVVWAELPYVTAPSLDGGTGAPALWTNAEEQLREQIRQNYNHPSILLWSVGNEVDSAKGFGVGREPAKPLALLQHLQAVAKEEDPFRPTAFADCCEGLSMIQTAGEKLAGTADLIGYNRYFGWYYPKPLEARQQLGAQMDKFHAEHPALPISVSEYGAGGAISQHSDNIRTGFINAIGRPQTEEYLGWVHEANWPAIRERDYIFASWVWNMFDFPSNLREEGDSVDLNTKGLVTFDRKVKKDAFYYYKAQWSGEPVLHLTGKRYIDRAYPIMDVKAYSNAERATLTINGRVVGDVACGGSICNWTNVPLAPGANDAVVTAVAHGQTVRDSMVWHGPDPALGIHIDAGDIAGRVLGDRRFGSDHFVTGGQPAVFNLGSFGGRSSGPKRTVEATEPDLYAYWREGDAFSYAIPVPNGKWRVTIHSFEPRTEGTEGQSMAITAQGKTAVPAFNIARAAAGPLKGFAMTFPVRVRDGLLRLDFAGQGGKAVVAAIEISK